MVVDILSSRFAHDARSQEHKVNINCIKTTDSISNAFLLQYVGLNFSLQFRLTLKHNTGFNMIDSKIKFYTPM